jgi:hypothetical protein
LSEPKIPQNGGAESQSGAYTEIYIKFALVASIPELFKCEQLAPGFFQKRSVIRGG